MANVNVKTFGFGTIGFYDRVALGRSEIICFCTPYARANFPENASLLTDGLQTSGWKFLCPELAVVIHFELIWSHLGSHFGSHDGTRSAQDEPRWAQEDHQELQSAENLHLQKPLETIVFQGFWGSKAIQDSF